MTPAIVPPRRILVGESNPYGADPYFALYPYPENSAGGRLCRRVLRLTPDDYLDRFDRRNLCTGKWRVAEARSAAAGIAEEVDRAYREGTTRTVVLLGSRVCRAFGVQYEPFNWWRVGDYVPCKSPSEVPHNSLCNLVILPHPSGLCRTWSKPGAYDRAYRVLVESGVL